MVQSTTRVTEQDRKLPRQQSRDGRTQRGLIPQRLLVLREMPPLAQTSCACLVSHVNKTWSDWGVLPLLAYTVVRLDWLFLVALDFKPTSTLLDQAEFRLRRGMVPQNGERCHV